MTDLTGLSKDGSRHVTDEVWNTAISTIGACLTVLGAGWLLWHAGTLGNGAAAGAFAVYGLGTLSVFVTSALHHGVDASPRMNHVLRQLDYFAIFLMIAGTFTPFCLLLAPGVWGQAVLGLVWLMAVLGIAAKAIWPQLAKWKTLAMTIGMGWMALFIALPVYQHLQLAGLVAVATGGVFFTGGGLIFGFERPNPWPGRFGFHEIWHCCVVIGAGCHFAAMCLCI